jgi:hypothetical protein
VPDGRKKLEDFILEQADIALKEAHLMTDDHFKKFLNENKKEIQSKIKELAKGDMAEDSLKDLEQLLEKEVGGDLKTMSSDLLTSLTMLNSQLKKLKENKKLTPDEQTERRVLEIARALQAQSSLDMGAARASTGGPAMSAKKDTATMKGPSSKDKSAKTDEAAPKGKGDKKNK